MPLLRTPAVIIAAALTCAVAPASALAATSGGVTVPGGTPSVPSVPSVPSTPSPGGAVQGETATSKKPSALTLSALSLNGAHFYEYGRAMRVSFELSGRGAADLKLVFVQDGKRVKLVDLGSRAAGTRHTQTVPVEGLPSGALQVKISGRDSRGRAIKQGPRAASSRAIDVRSHRFPVVGPHGFGAEGSKFGADRDGGKRKHQGQDVAAAEGTPMVAARGGVVRVTGNQPSGAGVYVVIRGAGENRDYVYMHLVEGSLLVRNGQTVRTGQLIGKVGNTGVGTGPHLHFEIWQGTWQGGGTPVDPLPLLQRWDSWS